MKKIKVQVLGSDGTPHGHGGFDYAPCTWEVTDEQYNQIKWYIENQHEEDLTCMDIPGINEMCQDEIDDILYWAKQRGDDPEDYSVSILVRDMGEES